LMLASLVDVSAGSGLTAKLENGLTPEKHLPETMVGGVALFDFDRDGKLDVFLANGAPQPGLKKTGPRYWNRLYRNTGNGKFVDVTERAGVQGVGFDIGAAAGDFDNDGFPDLFVAVVRSNALYRNRGDGTFEDVTAKAGLGTTGKWAVAGGWFDMDNDGDLDLFVVNYVQWDPAKELLCGETVRTYCHPKHYAPEPNTLYRNNGDGTFTDVSVESGIAAHPSKGMGLAFGDADGDGLLDVFVTNDTQPNSLFRNEGGGRFREMGGPAGVAFNDDGRAL
ncbi:MAG: RNA-binding protein, partial [Acidobacteriia bacterium 12-62-4]